MFHIYRDLRFERLASISNGHIYNLRKRREYRTGRLTFRKTRPTPVSIGVRRKPRPDGQPGFLRVDTVHLGDHDGKKGIYVLNVVDEVTQFQHLGAVPRITQHFMVLMLKDLLSAFPFAIQAFHADNGSEYINRNVADLLNDLHIDSFTKCRPRHCNDNALVESKNGSVVRKWLGHVHVPHSLVPQVNAYLHDHLCPLLNFHRPCLFPTEVVGPTGRVKRRYRQEDVTTPYERFKALPGAEDFLRPGVTLDALDQRAAATNHLDAAQAAQRARDELFRAIGQGNSAALTRLVPTAACPETLPQTGLSQLGCPSPLFEEIMKHPQPLIPLTRASPLTLQSPRVQAHLRVGKDCLRTAGRRWS